MDHIWQQHYEQDVPLEINPQKYKSIVGILDEAMEKYKDRDAFHCMGRNLTYADIDALSKRFAIYLTKVLGLKKGSKVALMMPNILQYPVALFGTLRAGMIVVNINPLYTARELEHQLIDSGAEAIVIFENSCSVLQSVLPKTKVQHVLTSQIGDMLKFPKSKIVNFVIKHVKKMVPSWSIPHAKCFIRELYAVNVDDFKSVEVESDSIAFLQYTGGTTGVSKGAELTHENIVANMLQITEWLKSEINGETKQIVITPLPLYHIFSLTANCFFFFSIGAQNVLITNPRDMPGFVKELGNWDFTALTGVNTLFNGLLSTPGFSDIDFSHMKLSLGGGMAVQKNVADKWRKVTHAPLLEAYGLSETSPAVCINPANQKEYNGTIGLPISSTIVSIRDDDGKVVAKGEPGELCVKGPQVMRGYWNRPEETAKVMTSDGFFKTGDIATMDEKGYFKIVDRKKDMILVSGFNVFPNEIEEVVCSHPGVFEAAAVGVADEKSGEVVKIFVVKSDQHLNSADLKSYCKENLTGYKVPRIIEFRESLPKSNVGKILRKELRA